MFKKGIFFLALACVGLAEGGPSGKHSRPWFRRNLDRGDKIVGGTDAQPGEFPYQVSVIYWEPEGIDLCGGGILTEKVVLTAARCVQNENARPLENFTVTAGAISIDDPGENAQTLTVKTAMVHPKYDAGNQEAKPYDICVLILNEQFQFNEYVQAVTLPEPGATFTGNATVSGWGSTSNTNDTVLPNVLQKVELPLIDYEECKGKFEESSLDELSNICTGPVGGNLSSCVGDSGGPLTVNLNGTTTIIGIVSWTYIPCGNGYPSVYTRVSSFIDFIKDSIEKSVE